MDPTPDIAKLTRRDLSPSDRLTDEEAACLRSAAHCGAWRDALLVLLADVQKTRGDLSTQYAAQEALLLTTGASATFEVYKIDHARQVSDVVRQMGAIRGRLREANELYGRLHPLPPAPAPVHTGPTLITPAPQTTAFQAVKAERRLLQTQLNAASVQINTLTAQLRKAEKKYAVQLAHGERQCQDRDRARMWGKQWRERTIGLTSVVRMALQVEESRGLYADPVLLERLRKALDDTASFTDQEWPDAVPDQAPEPEADPADSQAA